MNVYYWIEEKEVEVRKWYAPWRSTKMTYYLSSLFGTIGPFDSEQEIREAAALAGIVVSGDQC